LIGSELGTLDYEPRDATSAPCSSRGHIASGIRHIATQEQIITDLDRGNHEAAVALDLLAIFRDMQDHLLAHRDRILAELEQ
jgi:hypothetical protein